MSASSAAFASNTESTERGSALVITGVRSAEGFSMNPHGQIEAVSYKLEYFEHGTRISLDDKKCVVSYKHSSQHFTLVHVQLGSDNVKPLHELWSGIVGGKLIGRNGNDCFVTIPIGGNLTVFYPDGSVAVVPVLKPSATALKFHLKPEHAFQARVERVGKMLEDAERVQGDDKYKRQDRNLHELAAIIGMSRRYPDLRKQVVDYVIKLGIPLRRNVFDHFRDVCDRVGDVDAWMQIRAYYDNYEVKTSSNVVRGGGKPLTEKQRKAARAQRDRQARVEMKGPPRNNDAQQQGFKNKK